MEKKEKRVRLSYEQLKGIVAEFAAQVEDSPFDTMDIQSFMEKKFTWFRNLTEEKKSSRASGMIEVFEKEYGSKLQKLSKSGGGTRAKYVISDDEVVIEKVSTAHAATILKSEKFYQILREAVKIPEIGISKVNVSLLMGYKTEQVSSSMLESINNEFERLCGFRPLVIDKGHTFTDYDVVKVANVEESRAILDDLLDKLGGEEPEEVPIDPKYHNDIKATIKKDYRLAMMFKPSGKVLFRGGDGHKFMREIMNTVSIGADVVAERYQEILKKRYDIDEYFWGISRKGFYILSEEKLNEALISIEDIYARIFCEDIVPHEESIYEKSKKDSAEVDTDAVIRIIETEVFHNKPGEKFLRDIWKHLDRIGIKRGWSLVDLLKETSDRFQVKYKSIAAYMEEYIIYTPIVEECVDDIPTEPNNEEKEEESLKDMQKDFDEVSAEFLPSAKKIEEYLDVQALFEERLDIEYFCKNLNYREFKKHRDEIVVKIKVDKNNKKEVLDLLRLHYASLRSDKVDLFIEYDEIQELESIILS